MKTNLNIIVSALIVTAIAIIIFFSFKYDNNKLNNQVDKWKKQVIELQKVIKKQDSVHIAESAFRKSIHIEDSLNIVEAIRLKKEDSLAHITTIKILIKKYKDLTDPELDQELKKRYENSITDTLTHN